MFVNNKIHNFPLYIIFLKTILPKILKLLIKNGTKIVTKNVTLNVTFSVTLFNLNIFNTVFTITYNYIS